MNWGGTMCGDTHSEVCIVCDVCLGPLVLKLCLC